MQSIERSLTRDVPAPTAAQPIARRALHEEVADRLREWITEGRLAPGSRLNERVLCEQLAVSRTPLLLRHEPDNPFDPNAVAVLSLHGHRIGYVPRGETGTYAASEWTLAYVDSKGIAAGTENVGVKVPRLNPSALRLKS